MNHLQSHQLHDSQLVAGRRDREGAAEHQGAAMTKGWHTIQETRPFSANGAASFQPGTTPQVRRSHRDRGLKARANRRSVESGFQPLGIFGLITQGEYAFSGVRPSSGAETQGEPVTFGQSDPLERADVAAAEDGRTPLNTYHGVALGRNEGGALPPGNATIAALDAESAEVLGNIKALI